MKANLKLKNRSDDFLMVETDGPFYPSKDEFDNVVYTDSKGNVQPDNNDEDN